MYSNNLVVRTVKVAVAWQIVEEPFLQSYASVRRVIGVWVARSPIEDGFLQAQGHVMAAWVERGGVTSVDMDLNKYFQ